MKFHRIVVLIDADNTNLANLENSYNTYPPVDVLWSKELTVIGVKI